MQEVKPFDSQRFFKVLDALRVPEILNRDFLFEIYDTVLEGLNEFGKTNLLSSLTTVNSLSVISYLINEHFYGMVGLSKEDIARFESDEKYKTKLASIVMDKYLTNEHLEYKEVSPNSRFYPPISTMKLYLNFILGMLTRFKKNNPYETLIVDMLNKAFSMGNCITDLLINGFETEAFSTWRTLHETECITAILFKYGKPVVERYLRHMTYAIAFRNGIGSKEKQDEIFVEIKANMHELDLKSKDMKRYIEYGWLMAVPNITSVENFKLNFRDGVERVAELSQYSSTYEMSSEIAHSSPLLIYSRKTFFNDLTLVNLYESFFRLEKIFFTVYTNAISEDEQKKYAAMRNVYYSQMAAIHQREKGRFILAAKKRGSKEENPSKTDTETKEADD